MAAPGGAAARSPATPSSSPGPPDTLELSSKRVWVVNMLLCWLALLMIRLAERQTGQTWRRIVLELGRLHQVTLTGPAGTVAHTTTLTDPQRQILTALKIDPPPPVTALTPA